LILAPAFWVSVAAAQEYPARPIRMVVGFSPGGGTDVVARIIVPDLSERLKQQIVIDNRPGATGTIAANLVAKAIPDGYTLLMGSVSSNAIAASVLSNIPYDSRKDFAPVTLTASVPHLVVVHASLKVNSVKELIAYARSSPGKLSFASTGIGSSSHLGGEVFKMMAGVDLVHVPYKGAGQSMTDQLGGQIPVGFNTVPASVRYVKTGQLVALAVMATTRSPLLPDMQTIGEAGLPGAEVTTWYGVFAPRNTPSGITRRLNAEINAVSRLTEVRKALIANGADDTVTATPEAFASMVDAEIIKYAKVVKTAGVRAE
jgi:tripartite-type tricarboxylate transporter receptor subunit TctC